MPTGESYLVIATKIIHKDGDLKAVNAYNQKRIVSNPIKAHFSRDQLSGYRLAGLSTKEKDTQIVTYEKARVSRGRPPSFAMEKLTKVMMTQSEWKRAEEGSAKKKTRMLKLALKTSAEGMFPKAQPVKNHVTP